MAQFWAFVKSVPALVALAEKLVGALEWATESIRDNMDLKKFQQAEDQASQTKDTSGIENIFNPKP